MSIGATLRKLLLDDPAVLGLVGTRVYPTVLPQAPTFPSITYQVVSRQGGATQEGPDAIARPRVQVDIWGKTNDQVITLARAVRQRLDGFRGPVAGEGDVQGIFLDTQRDLFDTQLLLYRNSSDFFVWHVED